ASIADLDRHLAERLRWYAGSARPATAVIRILAPAASLDDIAALPTSAIATDGSTITIGDTEIAVPDSSTVFLRAQHLALRFLGTDSHHYLRYRRGLKT